MSTPKGIGVGWGREGEVSYYRFHKQHNTACRSTRKEMMGVINRSEHTSGKWEGGGGRGSVILQVTLTA